MPMSPKKDLPEKILENIILVLAKLIKNHLKKIQKIIKLYYILPLTQEKKLVPMKEIMLTDIVPVHLYGLIVGLEKKV